MKEKIKVSEPEVIRDGDKVYMNDDGKVTTDFIYGRFVGYAYPSLKHEEGRIPVSKHLLEMLKVK